MLSARRRYAKYTSAAWSSFWNGSRNSLTSTHTQRAMGKMRISSVPQTTDLLDTYRGLISLGKIKHDEEQLRVVMQVSGIS